MIFDLEYVKKETCVKVLLDSAVTVIFAKIQWTNWTVKYPSILAEVVVCIWTEDTYGWLVVVKTTQNDR